MNKDEAKVVLLEEALESALNKINFLHNCLVNPSSETNTIGGYRYTYPESTIEFLEETSKLIPEHTQLCMHSGYKKDCKSCNERVEQSRKVFEAKRVLSGEE